MEALIALGSVALGAAAVLAGQLGVRRSEKTETWLKMLVEQCARISMLEKEFGRRAAYISSGISDPTTGWSIQNFREAEGLIRILSTDPALHESIDLLNTTGRAVYHATAALESAAPTAQAEFAEALDRHNAAVASFEGTAQQAIQKKRVV